MDAAITHSGIVDVDARTEGDAAVIAARAFRATGDVLRTIINGVLIKRMRRRRRCGRFVIRTASKSFMIGTGGRASPRGRSATRPHPLPRKGTARSARGRGAHKHGTHPSPNDPQR